MISATEAPMATSVSSTVGEVPAERRLYFVMLWAMIVSLILPIWTVTIVPWADLGDHLARSFIISNYQSVQQFQRYFEVTPQPLPNLAIDVILTPMLGFLAPLTAVRVFASLSVLIFAAGCHVFGKAMHGCPSWLALPALFLFYNSLLLYGFVNYMWGIALFLLTAAVWLAFEKKPTFGNGALATLLATATYFAHLSGFFFLCVFVGIFTALNLFASRRLKLWHVLAFVPLVPALLAFISPKHNKGDTSLVLWATPREKLLHMWVLFSGYSTLMDAVTLVGMLAVGALVFRYGKPRMERRPLILSIALLLGFLLFPTFMQTGSDADTRFLLPFALTAVLGVSFTMPRQAGRITFAVLLCLMMTRVTLMTWYWQRADRISVEQLALLDHMKDGAVVYPMIFLPHERTASKTRQQLMHLAGYATVDRHAISGNTFAVAGQQLISRRRPLWYNFVALETPVERIDWKSVLSEYDYVWAYNPPPAFDALLNSTSDSLERAGSGHLYHLNHNPPGALGTPSQ